MTDPGEHENRKPGPGWWIASDGRLYPPELHPSEREASPQNAPVLPPQYNGPVPETGRPGEGDDSGGSARPVSRSRGKIFTAVGVGVVGLVAVVAVLVTRSPKPESATEGGSKDAKAVTLTLAVAGKDWDDPRSPGEGCEASDVSSGYGDIATTTPVKITDIREEVLARGQLEAGTTQRFTDVLQLRGDITQEEVENTREAFKATDGEIEDIACVLTATLTIERGSDGGDGYVVSVGDRGEITASWEGLDDAASTTFILGQPYE